jgi:AraC-like DNA-binding protein
VAQLAEASGLSERTLQRLFAGAAAVDWAVLAADLGYADQAHLTRDFTATLDGPPSRYAAGPG